MLQLSHIIFLLVGKNSFLEERKERKGFFGHILCILACCAEKKGHAIIQSVPFHFFCLVLGYALAASNQRSLSGVSKFPCRYSLHTITVRFINNTLIKCLLGLFLS